MKLGFMIAAGLLAVRLGFSDPFIYEQLKLEKSAGFEVTESDYSSIDQLLDNIEQRIANLDGQYYDIVKTIDNTIKESGYIYRNDVHLITDCIEQKRTNCAISVLIYLAVAERLGLPFSTVKAPSHVFLRVMSNDDYFNWETTSGEILPDSFYARRLDIDEKSIKDGVFMQNLSEDETRAILYHAVAYELYLKEEYEQAIPLLNKALELHPHYPEAHNTLAHNYYRLGNIDAALIHYLKCIEGYPNYVNSYIDAGDIYFQKKDFEKAIFYHSQAIQLEPKNAVALYCRGYNWYCLKEFDKAVIDFDLAVKFGDSNIKQKAREGKRLVEEASSF